ncbi:MAG TPA: universal stress protein [Micromonosporaceae bacterium]|nr:universal stress protein [Micromonosporaceae bacterium]
MSSYVQPPVLVGVDGSRGALDALRLAAAEAALHGFPLRILHSARVDVRGGHVVGAEAAARAVRRYPGLPVFVHAVRGRAESVLAEEAGNAAMTVLGRRGANRRPGPLAGSVSSHVAARARGPVVVVRGDRYEPTGRRIVVGVDGSAGSEAATGFAFEEAAKRGAVLHPMLVWTHPAPGDLEQVGYGAAEAAQAAAFELETALAGWREKYPDVPVAPVLVRSRYPERKLLEATVAADLIVVGRDRPGGIGGLLGGTVGHTLVHHAECPVAIVPEVW